MTDLRTTSSPPAGSTPAGSTPAGSTPAGSTPAGGPPDRANPPTRRTSPDRSWLLTQLLSPALGVLALVLWLAGLAPADVDALGGFGLVTELHWPVLLSYPVLLVAGVLELVRPERTGRPMRSWWMGLLTALLVLMVYGLMPAVEGVARLPIGWLHAGFAETIGRNGEVVANFDTRMSWPGFFSTAAMWGRAAGIDDVRIFLNWAPLVFAGLAVLGVRALASAVLPSNRAAWIATWIFAAADWTEQDYFSPQGMAYVLLIAAMAVTAEYLIWPRLTEGGRVLPWQRRQRPGTSPKRRLMAQFLGLALAVGLAPSHQLTPYVLSGMLLVLVLWGRLAPAWLAILSAVPAVAWFFLAGKEFWVGQLTLITGSIGDVSASVDQGIGGRVVGDVGHLTMVGIRVGILGALALTSIVGLLVLRRRGTRTWALPALAASAFALAVLQPYGGEIFLRCYLYSLPWFCIGTAVAADALVGRTVGTARAQPRHGSGGSAPRSAARRWPAVVTSVALSVLCLGTVIARGGNDAFVAMTTADEDAMDYVYATAPKGSSLIALVWYAPLRVDRVDDLVQISTEELATPTQLCDTEQQMVECLVKAEADYVLISPQQDRAGVILEGRTPGWTGDVQRSLVKNQGYRVVFSERDRIVLAGPGVAGPS